MQLAFALNVCDVLSVGRKGGPRDTTSLRGPAHPHRLSEDLRLAATLPPQHSIDQRGGQQSNSENCVQTVELWAPACSGAHELSICHCFCSGLCGEFFYRRDQAVAAPCHRLDVRVMSLRFAERPA